jgi:hypothetical protein
MLSPGETEREKNRRRKSGGKREKERRGETEDRKRLTVLWRRLPLPITLYKASSLCYL